VPRRSGQPRVLEIASQALSTMMMGQRTQDAAILVNARNLYSHALIRLRDGIEQPRPRSEWPQLLLATMMLQILEVRLWLPVARCSFLNFAKLLPGHIALRRAGLHQSRVRHCTVYPGCRSRSLPRCAYAPDAPVSTSIHGEH
jgi:hypothetical protein